MKYALYAFGKMITLVLRSQMQNQVQTMASPFAKQELIL
ncbi:hypothetical protein SAMN05216575_101487 [Ectopseudomonas alcaliphila]|uniref:Uncharacterized protein n=1 Tax=Ectopseudomonas alcaliphila TaxID=101564 RepID=A0A1G6UFR8_9GAMM|nr:hypothetical protein SAMN05216575_101487 [Pseudomonas alcaliphila]